MEFYKISDDETEEFKMINKILTESLTNSYKIYWFKSIYDYIVKGQKEIDFKALVIRMISNAWETVIKYKLSLGVTDNLQVTIMYLNNKYIHLKRIKELNEFEENIRNLNDDELNKRLKSLIKYVPYRLLTPFYKDKAKELNISTNSKDYEKFIEEQSKSNESLYTIIDDRIIITDKYFEYIYLNQDEVLKIIKNSLIVYLKKKNIGENKIKNKIFKTRKDEYKTINYYNEKPKNKNEEILLQFKSLIRKDKLIGNLVEKNIYNEEFIEFINKRAEEIIINNIDSPCIVREKYYEVIISLTICAAREYEEGNLWDYIYELYPKAYDKFNDQKVNGKIREIITLINSEYKGKQIELILNNTIVPQKYLKKYFKFMYQIYMKELACEINENTKSIMFGVFNNIAKNKKNDIFNNYLIESTKRIINDRNNSEELVEYSIEVLKCIDKYYWNKENELENMNIDEYFLYGFNEWKEELIKEKQEQVQVYNETKEKQENIVINKTPIFKFDNEKVCLESSEITINKEINYKKVYILIKNDEKNIGIEAKPYIKKLENDEGYIILPKIQEINKPLGKLRLLIYEDEEKIYDTKSNLYRDYIIFNNENDEIKMNSNYTGSVKIITPRNKRIQAMELIKKVNYNIFLGNVSPEDVIKLEDTNIYFRNHKDNKIIGEKVNFANAYINNNLSKIYKNVSKFTFETKIPSSDILIKINDEKFKLKDLNYTVENYLEEINGYEVDISTLCESGNYLINVQNIRNNVNIAKFSFILDKDINIKCDYNYDKKYLISLESDFKLYDSEDNLCEKIFEIDTNDIYEIEKYIKFKDVICKYIFDLPIEFYNINNGKWKEFSEYIWEEDLDRNSYLNFKNFEYEEAWLEDNKNELLYDFTKFDGKLRIFKVLDFVNNIVYLNLNGKEGLKRIEILKNDIYDKKKSIIKYNEEESNITVIPYFKGKHPLNLMVTLDEEIVLEKKLEKSEEEIIIDNVEPLGKYKFEFYETLKSTNIFLGSTETNILYSEILTCYSSDSIMNIKIPIKKGEVGSNPDKLRNIKIKERFIVLNEKININKFKGNIYDSITNKKLRNINPVTLEIVERNSDDTIKVTMVDKDEDGLLYNGLRERIADNNSSTLQDIYEYELTLKGIIK